MMFDIISVVTIFVVEMIYSVTYGTCDYGVDIQGIARHSPEPPSIASIQAWMRLVRMKKTMLVKTMMWSAMKTQPKTVSNEHGETGESGIKYCHGFAGGMDGYLPSTLIIKLFT